MKKKRHLKSGVYMPDWFRKLLWGLVGLGLSGIGAVCWAWFSKVNASVDTTERLEVIVPRVEEHMKLQTEKMDDLLQRQARMEGRLQELRPSR